MLAFSRATLAFFDGRFSLDMLLPSMGVSLGLSYSQMGLIGTGNFVGYMISVFLAGILRPRIAEKMDALFGIELQKASIRLVNGGSPGCCLTPFLFRAHP